MGADVNMASRALPVSRRAFLRRGSALTAASMGLGAVHVEASLRAIVQAGAAPTSEADFWKAVRAEFMITDDDAYMNNGTLGPTPKPVFYTLVERYRALAGDPGDANGQQYRQADEVRRIAAAFVGANADEIALTRNTTEGMGFVANGLDLEAGDEVLLTFHEHPGGLEPWRLRAKRTGIVLKELQFPTPPSGPADILTVFNDAISPRTRVISVSHVMFQTGTMVPVKALAALARSKGILMVVDGAHPLGMLDNDMHDLGIDCYAMSAHKWLSAPSGTGLLYVRHEVQDRLWPTVVSTGWDDPQNGAKRFDRLSQSGWPLVLAVGAAMEFQNRIGRPRIEARVRALHSALRSRVARMPGVTIHTSVHPELSCGLLAFTFGSFRNHDVVETLAHRHHIRVRAVDYGLNAVRVSTHYYNTEAQIERVEEALQDIVSRGVLPATSGGHDE